MEDAPVGAIQIESGVVSLLAMLTFYAEPFFKKVKELTALEATFHVGAVTDRVLPAEMFSMVYSSVGVFATLCATHGLPNSTQKCARIHKEMESRRDKVTFGEAAAWLKDLRERVEDELGTHCFLQLTPSERELYLTPVRGWESVITRFPKVRNDVEESSKCFALNRSAACLFHVLLVAEYGVIEVAKLFGVEGDKPGWGAVERLQRLNDKIWSDKTPLERENSELLSRVLPLMLSIKNEWRHKINHVDNKLEWIDTDFSPEVAKRIVSATLGFMLCLASDLPKQEKSKQ